jgi:hypothetical protein
MPDRLERHTLQCKCCNKDIICRITEFKKFCSRKCKNDFSRGKTFEELYGEEEAIRRKLLMSENAKGENNPNYNNPWSDEQRKNQSDIMHKRYEDPEARYRAGTSNRGKKFSKERIEKMHGHRTFESYSRPMPNYAKIIIGEKSSAKWTPEFTADFRKTMESKGHWIPLENKTEYDIYGAAGNWVDRMWDQPIKGTGLIEEYGIFNSISNSKGVVRDHIFNRRDGLAMGVFPEILRHPANCQIITHADNVKKRSNSEKTLDRLLQDILEWKYEWFEQSLAVEKVNMYLNGFRWINEFRKEESE